MTLLLLLKNMYAINNDLFVIELKVSNINKLKEKRLEKGWSQHKLSERSGVPQPTICQIENGSRKYPTHENIRKIAKALGINLDELMDS